MSLHSTDPSHQPANWVMRISEGTALHGQLHFEGSVLLHGRLSGQVRINGRLVIMPGARASGRLRVSGDVSLLGELGDVDDGGTETVLECGGKVLFDEGAHARATVISPHFEADPRALFIGSHIATREALPTLKNPVHVPDTAN